jgi:hypothetical protein
MKKTALIIFCIFQLFSTSAHSHWITALEDAIKAAAKSSKIEKAAAEAVTENANKIKIKPTPVPMLSDTQKANISFQSARIISHCKIMTKDILKCESKKQALESCISKKLDLSVSFDTAAKDCESDIIY